MSSQIRVLALLAIASVGAGVGCGTTSGGESETFDKELATDAGKKTKSQPDAGLDATSSGLPADTGISGVCAQGGPIVYRFVNGDRYTFSTSTNVPSGFSLQGPVFRLAQAGTPGTELYVLYSSQAEDYMLTQNQQEGAGIGYSSVAKLGFMYGVKENDTVALLRFVKASPLRHYAALSAANVPSGFTQESASTFSGFVCPP